MLPSTGTVRDALIVAINANIGGASIGGAEAVALQCGFAGADGNGVITTTSACTVSGMAGGVDTTRHGGVFLVGPDGVTMLAGSTDAVAIWTIGKVCVCQTGWSALWLYNNTADTIDYLISFDWRQ